MVEENRISEKVIGAAIEVHKHLGPGLLEAAYETCLCRELQLRGVPFAKQVEMPVSYKGEALDCGYRVDMIVDSRVIVEIKAVESLQPIHEAQVLTYLRLTGLHLGLLLNFCVPTLKRGIRRIVLGLPEEYSASSASLR